MNKPTGTVLDAVTTQRMVELLREVADYGVCRATNDRDRKAKLKRFETIALKIRHEFPDIYLDVGL